MVDSGGAPDFSRGRPDGIDFAAKNELLDFLFDLVVQLVAVVPEKFDAVVFVGIVRSGKNDAGIGAQRARDVGDTGRGQRADNKNIDTERSNPGDERILKHITGKARVFPQHNLWARTFQNRARI